MMGNVKRLGGRIVPDTVELYGETFWREETIDAHFVELEEALEGLVRVIEAAGLDNLSRGVQLGATSWYVKASDALRIAKQVIAPPSTCDHEWADARNKAIQDGEICLKCHAIRAGNVGSDSAPPDQESK